MSVCGFDAFSAPFEVQSDSNVSTSFFTTFDVPDDQAHLAA